MSDKEKYESVSREDVRNDQTAKGLKAGGDVNVDQSQTKKVDNSTYTTIYNISNSFSEDKESWGRQEIDLNGKKPKDRTTDIKEKKALLLSKYDLQKPCEKLSDSVKMELQVKMEEHRMLIISSPFGELNDDAILYLTSNIKELEAFQLPPEGFARENVFTTLSREDKLSEHELIITYLDTTYIKKFQNIIHDSSLVRYSNQLKQQNRFLLFIHQMDPTRTTDSSFKEIFKATIYYELEFTRLFLKKKFSDYEFWVSKLVQQRNLGLWGDADDLESFFYKLSREPDLKSAIEVRATYDPEENESPQGFLERTVYKISAKDFIPKSNNVLKLVIFIITYFKEINLLEFEEIIGFILDQHEPPKMAEVKAGASKKLKKKVGKKKSKDRSYLLQVDWKENKEKIYKEAKLQQVTGSGFSEVIDFQHPHLREELQKFFNVEDPLYLLDQFHILKKPSIFLSGQYSNSFRVNLVALLAQMAAKYPDNFGYSYLLDCFHTFKNQTQFSEALGNVLKLYDFEQDKKDEIQAVQELKIIQEIIKPIVDLLDEMLEFKHLRRLVERFLNTLLGSKDLHGSLLVSLILGEVTDRGTFHTNFEVLNWVKKVIENERLTELEWLQTYRLLNSIWRSNLEKFPEMIVRIDMWRKESAIKGNSENFSMFLLTRRFFLDLFDEQLKDIGLGELGRHPPTHVLFSNLPKEEEKLKLYFGSLVDGILDQELPVVKAFYANPTNQDRKVELHVYWETQFLIAHVIEEWFLLLRFRDDEWPEAGKNISDILLSIVAQKVDIHIKNRLLLIWKRSKNNYLEIANSYNRQGEKLARSIKLRQRGCIKKLISEFYTIYKKQNLKKHGQ